MRWLPDDFEEGAAARFRRPFHTFLLKIASLCNLDCSYCYVYQSPDDSWRWKPKFLERETAIQIAARIQEHVDRHELEDVTIVFHGGEPLLVGPSRLRELVECLSAHVSCRIHWGMQTNGTLLDDSIVRFLFERGFRIGLSLDGNQEHNDRHRVFHNGKSAYDETISAIRLLMSYDKWKDVFGGILVVVDVRNRPADIMAAINGLGIHSANFVLPDGHHESPPPNFVAGGRGYGTWLCDLFDVWYNSYPHIEVSYFEQVVAMMLGGISSAEEIGAQSVDLVVVDTNGDIEAVDTLKIVGREATSLGMNVASHSFDDALQHPAIYSRLSGFNALCSTCRQCDFVRNCGGGYLPHRYSHRGGFLNPSVYCDDLKLLFRHIRKNVFVEEHVADEGQRQPWGQRQP